MRIHNSTAGLALALALLTNAPAAAQQEDAIRIRVDSDTQLRVSGARMPDGSALHTFGLPLIDGHVEIATAVRTVEPAGWQVPLFREDTRITVDGEDVPLDAGRAGRFEGAVRIDSALLRASFARAEVLTYPDSVVVRPRSPTP